MVFEDATLSYRELDERANRLAHHLRGRGVGPEVVVGLCLERSPEMVIGLLAILKAGGAYLPLDPAYPRERLAFMLDDAGAPVLVTHSALAGRLASHRADTVRVDADAAAIAAEPASAPAVTLDPHHPAYVIYTSGSTGTPKGVVVATQSRQQIVRLAQIRVAPDCRSRPSHLVGFDASIEQVLLPLVWRRCAVVISDAVRESAVSVLTSAEPTASRSLSCVPSYLKSVLWSAPDNASLQIICSAAAKPSRATSAGDFRAVEGRADNQPLWSDRGHDLMPLHRRCEGD